MRFFVSIPPMGVTARDALFVSGRFLEVGIPKEYDYLYHYLRTDTQIAYAVYFLTFNTDLHFESHTGLLMNKRRREVIRKRINEVISTYEKAREEGNFSLVAEIASGKFKPTSRYKPKKKPAEPN